MSKKNKSSFSWTLMKKVDNLYSAEYEPEYLAKKIEENKLLNVTVNPAMITLYSDVFTNEKCYLTFIFVEGHGAACNKDAQSGLIKLLESNGWRFY